MRHKARLSLGCLMTCGVLGSFAGAGCGGLGPGDYATYRVGFTEVELSSGCQQGDPDDSSTVRSGNTLMIFVVATDGDPVPYLDTGSFVLEGVENDEGYDFEGTTIDVEDDGDRTFTTTTHIVVGVTLDGATMSGTTVVNTTVKCSGDCGGFDEETCEATTAFTGVQVEESISVPSQQP